MVGDLPKFVKGFIFRSTHKYMEMKVCMNKSNKELWAVSNGEHNWMVARALPLNPGGEFKPVG